MLPIELPEGHGMKLSQGDLLVMQLHYFQSGPDAVGITDCSGYDFKTEESVSTEVLMYPLGVYSFAIPAGQEHTEGGSFTNTYPVSLEAHAVFPHMHVLGRGYDMRVLHPDGSETCVASGDYDFDNQLTYQWEEPVVIEPGDTIDFSCTWADAEHTTYFGQSTDEEMCFFFTYLNLK